MLTVRLWDIKIPGLFLGTRNVEAEDLEEFEAMAGGLGCYVEVVE